jgi:hypothetical protein
MAGGTEVETLAGDGKQVLMTAVFVFYAGETIVQISTIEIPVNDLLEIGSVESGLSFKPLFIDLDKGLISKNDVNEVSPLQTARLTIFRLHLTRNSI